MRTESERQDIRERFLHIDAASVADVLDGLGLPEQGLSSDLQAVSGDALSGWAYTIEGRMESYGGSGDPRKMDACQGIGPQEVSVWAGDGEGVCYFGELIALGMAGRGSVGALVDGGLRDVRALREVSFPTFARYRSVVQSIGRWRVTGFQTPVTVAGATTPGVTVRPGDFILADEDGAIVIPDDRVEEVLSLAEALTQVEGEVRDALVAGMDLTVALKTFGHV